MTHFHMLVLDGAYLVGTEPPVFRRIMLCLVRCEHPMKPRQMHPRRRYQRRKGREAPTAAAGQRLWQEAEQAASPGASVSELVRHVERTAGVTIEP